MAVIAKLIARNIHDFGSGRLVELGCICDNDLMAAYAQSEDDKLFTKYSPWGEMKLHQPNGYSLTEGEAYYVVILRSDEAPENGYMSPMHGGPSVAHPARIVSITDFGDNQAKRVEICDGCRKVSGHGAQNFNWKMSVDNPPAVSQMVPGIDDYWVVFYPAARFDRDKAIHAALGAV